MTQASGWSATILTMSPCERGANRASMSYLARRQLLAQPPGGVCECSLRERGDRHCLEKAVSGTRIEVRFARHMRGSEARCHGPVAVGQDVAARDAQECGRQAAQVRPIGGDQGIAEFGRVRGVIAPEVLHLLD